MAPNKKSVAPGRRTYNFAAHPDLLTRGAKTGKLIATGVNAAPVVTGSAPRAVAKVVYRIGKRTQS